MGSNISTISNNSRPGTAKSNNSVRTWGSINSYAYRAQADKEEEERKAKQNKISAFLSRAKQGSPTGKSNTSWIKKKPSTRRGGRSRRGGMTRRRR